MARSDYELSTDRGQPVQLFEFRFGSAPGDLFFRTNHFEAVAHDGETYVPEAIQMDAVKVDGTLKDDEIGVEIPRSGGLSDRFTGYPPPRPITLIVREGNIPSPDDPPAWASGLNYPVVWMGRITESSSEGATRRLAAESLGVRMKQPGLRKHYQLGCPLVLYGSRCQASKAAATMPATASSVGAAEITISGFTIPTQASGLEKFIGGLVEWSTGSGLEVRTILRISGVDSFLLSGPTRNLSPGDSVDVILGCAHDTTDCLNLHDNITHYGGYPFIPTENPVGRNNHT